MLRFRLDDRLRLEPADAPEWAYIVGKESLTIPGHVVCTDGEIRIRKSAPEAAALAVRVDLGEAGERTLQTCLLPDRDAPYSLAIELVRHRLMMIFNKIEDWNLTDLPPDHPIMVGLENLRRLFTESLVEPDPASSQAAYEALGKAIELSELIVRTHADRQLRTRLRAAAATERRTSVSAPQVGCLAPPHLFSESLTRAFRGSFDFLGAPVSWNIIEPEEGKFSFVSSDKWIAWGVQEATLPVVAGPVLDFAGRSVPSWLHIWEHDFQSVREFAFEHARRVVTRYRKAVTRWIPISGINTNEVFSFSPEQMVDMTRLAVLLTRKIHQNARVTIEVDQPFGEHVTINHKGLTPLMYLQMVIESGVPFESIGLRLQFGDACPGHSTRDLMQIAALLDAFAQFDKTVHITAFGVPSAAIDPDRPHADIWTEPAQAQWLNDVARLALSKPYVQSICWQSLYDNSLSPEHKHGGLFRDNGTPKPAARKAAEIRLGLQNRNLQQSPPVPGASPSTTTPSSPAAGVPAP